MNEREFLETQTRLVRRRLGRSAGALGAEIERVVAPVVREHPRSSLVAGALAGLLLGRRLAPGSAPVSDARRGPTSGAWSFTKGTGVYALRAWIVGSLLSARHKDVDASSEG